MSRIHSIVNAAVATISIASMFLSVTTLVKIDKAQQLQLDLIKHEMVGREVYCEECFDRIKPHSSFVFTKRSQ